MQLKTIIFMSGGLPHPFHGGGGITAFSIVTAMVKQGYSVTVCGLRGQFESKYDVRAEEELKKNNVSLAWLTPKETVKNGSKSSLSLLNRDQYQIDFNEIVEEVQPVGIITYHWEALAVASTQKGNIPLFAFVGDPLHLPYLFREKIYRKYNPEQFGGIKEKVSKYLKKRQMIKEQKILLNKCLKYGAFAAHHARWFRDNGAKACDYYRTPVPDPFYGEHFLNKSKEEINKKNGPCLLLLGHLAGTATLAGIDLFVSEVLPELNLAFGEHGFEVRVVGGMFEQVPEKIKQKMKHPAIKILGQINPPDEQFASADILVVPTPVELGIRVRIVTGFSYEACVVAHEANKAGIPELISGKNCLLSSNGSNMAQQIIALWNNPDLRKILSKAGRQTYEKLFSLEAAGGAIAKTVHHTLSNIK